MAKSRPISATTTMSSRSVKAVGRLVRHIDDLVDRLEKRDEEDTDPANDEENHHWVDDRDQGGDRILGFAGVEPGHAFKRLFEPSGLFAEFDGDARQRRKEAALVKGGAEG